MDEPQLSEDLSQWPRDPYALLGVEVGIATRELRKAYSRLIRRFKPEQFPEHFRRIRDAYETIERELKFNQRLPAPQPAEPPTPIEDDGLFGQCIEETGGAVRVNPWYPSLSQSQEDEVEQVWNEAVHGDMEGAYLKLVKLHEGLGNRAELPQRLYWLLVVRPQLDDRRTACDWLVAGMCRPNSGGCTELYRREIDRNPAEALTVRYRRLLESAQPPALGEYVHWRWLAANRLGRGDVIAGDLDDIGPRLRPDNEETWIRLLLLAVDALAWFDEPVAVAGYDRCVKEIDEASHVHARLGEALVRLDVVRETAVAVRRLQREGNISTDLAELLRKLWHQPLACIRAELLGWVDRKRQEPHRWLRELDLLFHNAPTALAHLGRSLDMLLDCLPGPYAEGRRPEVLADLVLEFMEGVVGREYSDLRPRLLDFCFSQLIAPETILQLLDQVPKYVHSGFTHYLQEDWPLRYACLGYRMFWASA